MSAKNSKNYPQAKRHGRSALILTILNIIFTTILSLLIIGLVAGYGCAEPFRSYGYTSYYYRRNLGKWFVISDSSIIIIIIIMLYRSLQWLLLSETEIWLMCDYSIVYRLVLFFFSTAL